MDLAQYPGISIARYPGSSPMDEQAPLSSRSKWQETAKRITLAAGPFLLLNSTIKPFVAVGFSAYFTRNSVKALFKDGTTPFQVVHTALAVVVLVGTIFAHPWSKIALTVQDLLVDIRKLSVELNNGDSKEALKLLLRIISSTLTLVYLTQGGIGLSILAYVLQAAILQIAASDELTKGRKIEGIGNFLLSFLRAYQGYGNFQSLGHEIINDRNMKGVPIGEVHEKWQFPSEHLPVGVDVDGVHIISWNVANSLNNHFNQPLLRDGLTDGDLFAAEMVESMTSSESAREAPARESERRILL